MCTMVGRNTIFLFAIFLLITAANAAKILVLLPIPAKSHVGAYQALGEELARRGHQLTVVTPYPRAKPLANYTEIIYEDTFPPRDSSEMNLFEHGKTNFIFAVVFMHKMFRDSCENLIKQPGIQNLIHGNTKYDLVIYEPIGSHCLYGLLHKLKAPSIQIVPNTIIPITEDALGNPSTMSYIPDMLMQTESVDFTARVFSVLSYCFSTLYYKLRALPKMEASLRKHFPDPDMPTIPEISAQASFLFLHSHPILNYPRPLNPNTIEVGGLHIKATRKLPQDLQTFLDDAPYGVIYFSLGSNVRSVDMPQGMLNAILKSFSKLQQKVLWKWEADILPGQPKNVRLGKWLPQHDILAHPNVKLFITHGGLMSIQEATYFGVPLVAIPVMGDQKFNALHAQSTGYAVVLEIKNITEQSLDWALHEVLHEPRYRETAQRLSRIFQDQPEKPLERAVYWAEYAIRHKGAPHMRSAALDLSFVQYYLLDVIAVLALLGLAVAALLALCVRVTARRLCSKSTKAKAVSKSKKKN